MKPRTTLLMAASMVALLTACSTQQGYASAQAMRRNQCLNTVDSQERLRCLKETNQSFDSYSKETDALKAPR